MTQTTVEIPLSDANDLDDVCRELGIQDSEVTPAEAVRGLNTEIDSLRANNERLRAAAARAMFCLGFFASVIKSGEEWSGTCEAEFNAAKTAYAAVTMDHHQP